MRSVYTTLDEAQLEREILKFGTQVFEEAKDSSFTVFDKRFYTGKLMDWAMQDAEFKVCLFRFIDVLPVLTSSHSVIQHAREYFEPVADKLPAFLKWGLFSNTAAPFSGLLAAPVVSRQIRSVASQFIVGENPREAIKKLRTVRAGGGAFTIDLLGEKTVSEKESTEYLERYCDLLETLSITVPSWPVPEALKHHRSECSTMNISVKLSALYSQVHSVASEHAVEMLCRRFSSVLRKAKEVGSYVYVDMEDSSLVSITLETFKRTLEKKEFQDYDRTGIVLQSYLRRTEDDLQELIRWARHRGTPIGIRLVKGAYWDTETILAAQQGWGAPVWQQKALSDLNFERLCITLLRNADIVHPAFGSHNIRSLVFAIKAAEMLGVDRSQFELQMLYGMAEPIKQVFIRHGFLVREYSPIGELIPGMGYLVRRLLENTANESFLRQSFREDETPETLLKKPQPEREADSGVPYRPNPRKEFTNTPLRDFSLASSRTALRDAITTIQQSVEKAPLLVRPKLEGKPYDTRSTITTFCTEDPTKTLGVVHLADLDLALQSVLSLHRHFPSWRETSVKTRAEVLFKTAEILEEKRDSLTALIVLEVGKQWKDADADVAEAIDFLNYYAREALRLGHTLRLGDIPGEENCYFYEPRGVCIVISPWNFPVAIPCGMFAAALVTGNTVLLKPAEQSSLVASKLFECFQEAGLPEGVAAFLPAVGEEVGPYLVEHPSVSTICFTGSKAVGLELITRAATSSDGAEHVKRVIAEMGGKNAIIIDDNADLDEAIQGVITSAFGYQGQKCSACSRVIVVGRAYETFTSRLKQAVKSMILGPASNPAAFVGPVIDKAAYERIQKAIGHARNSCTVIAEAPEPLLGSPKSHYIRPIVFTDVPDEHSLWKEELFGPVLAVSQAPDFETALHDALRSQYALTGAVFSRSPKNIALAKKRFRVGNLYINRGSTGALVYRQPFGGARMSGVGSKAGGPDYLLQFVIPRAISENTLRRGFAPE